MLPLTAEEDAMDDGPTITPQLNAPFGRLAPVKGDDDRGGYIGMVKNGKIIAGFATIDPMGMIWTDHEADLVAEAVIACWNACADAGLTLDQMKAGIIKKHVPKV